MTAFKMEIGNEACHWIKNWEVDISFDGKHFDKIYSSEDYSNNSIIQMDKIQIIQYFQISGSSGPSCPISNKMAIKRVYYFGTLPSIPTCQLRFIFLKHFFTLLSLIINLLK